MRADQRLCDVSEGLSCIASFIVKKKIRQGKGNNIVENPTCHDMLERGRILCWQYLRNPFVKLERKSTHITAHVHSCASFRRFLHRRIKLEHVPPSRVLRPCSTPSILPALCLLSRLMCTRIVSLLVECVRESLRCFGRRFTFHAPRLFLRSFRSGPSRVFHL